MAQLLLKNIPKSFGIIKGLAPAMINK